ncbi:Retrovirus-related Pol polyprotein from transposon TNT 1-94 [Cardamine amara subsp. amara]|uniref:Retrovirus-related Pol polyprotein from transposon TNT 1-94 n=1 Tax=Cardamine amara subsp. amara TaxID=228776 RepID=A0ABD1AL54_CARAN
MTLRTGRGGEFTSREFNNFCESNGIKRHLTAPYTPQQNGVVKRRNQTLMEMTRSILKAMKVPNFPWGEAVCHATYIINRVPTRALENMTPYESLRKKKPSLDHIRVFGCLAYAKIETTHLKKLDDRSQTLVHLGIEPGTKAYRLYNPSTRKVIVSRDVVFDEKTSWSWERTTNGPRRDPCMFHMRWGEVIDVGEGPVVVNENQNQDHDHGETGSDNEDFDDDNDQDNNNNTEEGDIGNNEPHHQANNQPPLRRSTRETHQPRYLEDYFSKLR